MANCTSVVRTATEKHTRVSARTSAHGLSDSLFGEEQGGCGRQGTHSIFFFAALMAALPFALLGLNIVGSWQVERARRVQMHVCHEMTWSTTFSVVCRRQGQYTSQVPLNHSLRLQ